MPTTGLVAESKPRTFRRTFAVLLFCLIVYNANGRLIATGDSEPARLIPFAILNHGRLFLDAYRPFPTNTWWIQLDQLGHWSSVFPIVLPVLMTPLYVPAAIYVHLARPPLWRFETLCGLLEKLFA